MEKELYELTNPQKSIWLTDKVYDGTPINNICGSIIIEEPVDFDCLSKSINYLLEKNESLRIKLIEVNGEIKQYIDNFTPIDIEIVDVDSLQSVKELESEIVSTPFVLLDSPLFIFKMFRLPNGLGGMTSTLHHLVSDAWTVGLVVNEVVDFYHSFLKCETPETDLPSYIDYIHSEKEYLKSEKFEKDKVYWEEVYKTIPEFATIPSMRYKPTSKLPYDARRNSFILSKDILNRVNELCKNSKTSIFNFLMAVFAIYIGRVSNLEEFVLGTPILNRSNFKEKRATGMFISTVPFKVSIDNSMDFQSLVSNFASDFSTIFRHQKYPYQYLLEQLRKTDPSIPSLYDVLISYQNVKSDKQTSEVPFSGRWMPNSCLSDSLQIHIYDMNDTGNLNIAYDYLISKYTEADIDALHNRIMGIISQILDYPNILVGDIEIVTSEEEDKLLKEFNHTSLDYDSSKTVVNLIEERVLLTPDKTALVFENSSLTYSEWNEKANSLAHYLKSTGVEQKDFVGILVNRSIEMMVGLLAILKCGACYLPIDPEYPTDRILFMLENSNAKTILVHEKTKNLLPKTYNTVNIEQQDIYYDYSKENLNLNVLPSDLIFLLYTSGSTGNPKGVILTHKNIVNFIHAASNAVTFSPEKTMVSLTTICFDIFVVETWVSLYNGLTVVIANEKQQTELTEFNKLCVKNKVNMMQSTPSRVNAFFSEDSSESEYTITLTDVIAAGEPFPLALLEKIRSRTTANIYNMYGPTETSVWSTGLELTHEKEVTIGKPLANTYCYILDKNKKLLPPYIPGELHIGGDGVSNGYLGNLALTSEKFILSGYCPGQRIYNTNDLAYYTSNGNIVHLGRTDFQVKIRGFRVELGEIENIVLKFDGIEKTIVVGIAGKYLGCYYFGEKDINVSDLVAHLMKHLPSYMIPSYFKKIDTIPLTPNGKVNRKALPPFEDNSNKITKPTTKTEKIIFNSILELLKIDINKLDINTPFFALGLDSLGLIHLQGAFIYYGFNLSTQDFYKYPTIAKLAEFIDSHKETSIETAYLVPENLKHSKDITYTEKLITENVLGNVFLTGANGFIGIHVLNEILETTNSKVYCLVRGNTSLHATSRLLKRYEFYFKKDLSHLINERIIVLNGDISNTNFGLEHDDIINLITNVSTIIHTAAIVKHYGHYSEFEKINVEGTKRIATLAYQHQKRFTYISSISVSGNYLVRQNNQNKSFDENDLYIGQHYTQNVYVNSKYWAEIEVLNLIEKGLNAKILRIGIIAGRYSDGVFQENINDNAFYNRIKSMALLGKISQEMLIQQIEFSPIDYCAKAIVLLSKTDLGKNKIYHLLNQNLSKIEQIITLLRKHGIKVDVLSKKDFEEYLLNISRSDPNNIALKGIVNDLQITSDNSLYVNYDFSVNIKSDYTIEYLNLLDFKWPICNDTYVDKLLNYMKEVGFL